MNRRASAVALPLRRIFRRPVCVVDTQGRNQPSALLHHLRDVLICQVKAVLNRIATAVERAAHPDAAIRMARNPVLLPVGLIRYCFDFLQRQRWLRDQMALLVHPRAMRHVNLDPICTVFKLLPRNLSQLYGPIAKLRTFRHDYVRVITFQRIAASYGNGPCCRKNAWSGNVTAIDGHLDPDVAVTRSLSLNIADSGEALLQTAPRRNRSASSPVRRWVFQKLDVISAFCRIFTLKKNVRVGINQTRQNRDARRKVNHLRSSRRLAFIHTDNLVSFYEDQHIMPRLCRGSINQRGG